ncbi:hypothetical protein MHZ92_06175 [Sporosarcina sp. ACRSL]|uniref:hypothetical protein n=1 Tax=Sporosarcina sp. ACRSL TaxID=2918215 RepID=UPI001EF482E0|nr:hypothetical protein [Sporosarcina sp. ACRSL]MCG7343711.1 hypothetical protein [Sporosarcina sp. ACRSL]
MNKALRNIFWGYLFIFFDFYIIMIDVFMDPIGYYLIYLGCARIVGSYPIAKKALTVGMIGIFVSLPSAFVNLSDSELPFGWSLYASILSIFKLVIAFYLFFVLMGMAKSFGDEALFKRTQSTFKYFVTIHFAILVFMSFSMNVSGDGWIALSVILVIAGILMDILFLILIRAFSRQLLMFVKLIIMFNTVVSIQ